MKSRNQMILNSRFYTELRGEDKALDLIVEKMEGPNGIVDLSRIIPDKRRWGTKTNAEDIQSSEGRLGFVTVGMPKKTFFNRLAKTAGVHFTVVSVCESEMEPTQILEYDETGLLLDEQLN